VIEKIDHIGTIVKDSDRAVRVYSEGIFSDQIVYGPPSLQGLAT